MGMLETFSYQIYTIFIKSYYVYHYIIILKNFKMKYKYIIIIMLHVKLHY